MRPPVNRRLRTLEDAVLKSESADGRGLIIWGSAHLWVRTWWTAAGDGAMKGRIGAAWGTVYCQQLNNAGAPVSFTRARMHGHPPSVARDWPAAAAVAQVKWHLEWYYLNCRWSTWVVLWSGAADRSLTSLLLLPPLPPPSRPTARLPCEPSKRFYVTLSVACPLADELVDDRLREKSRIKCETNENVNEHLIR